MNGGNEMIARFKGGVQPMPLTDDIIEAFKINIVISYIASPYEETEVVEWKLAKKVREDKSEINKDVDLQIKEMA